MICNQPILLKDDAATQHAGAALASFLQPGDCVLLHGDLGAGKTTFVRGLLTGHAVAMHLPACDVPSPTFTLVQIYPFGDLTFYHYDLYRLNDDDNERDLVEIGFEESLNDGIVLVEWPQRLGGLTPPDALHVTLEPTSDDRRTVTLSGNVTWNKRLETFSVSS